MDDPGKATMKKMAYTNEIDDEIISHENNMLALYREKIKEYMPLFEEYGCSLKVGLMWNYFPGDTVTCRRGSFKNGYLCYVYCEVQKDGNVVSVDSNDGEADYYTLSTEWNISSITRKFFKLIVVLCTDTDEVDEDLNVLLSHLKDSRVIAQ